MFKDARILLPKRRPQKGGGVISGAVTVGNHRKSLSLVAIHGEANATKRSGTIAFCQLQKSIDDDETGLVLHGNFVPNDDTGLSQKVTGVCGNVALQIGVIVDGNSELRVSGLAAGQ